LYSFLLCIYKLDNRVLLLDNSSSRPTATMLADAWTHTPQSALGFYGTNASTGLSDGEVRRNREKYGENCESTLYQNPTRSRD
jgi:hypothetical protein